MLNRDMSLPTFVCNSALFDILWRILMVKNGGLVELLLLQVCALFACKGCPHIVALQGWWISQVDKGQFRFNMALELMDCR